MIENIEGIYAGYMTGEEGNGFSMFTFLNGIVSGADPLGVTFDGTYEADENGYRVDVKVSVPSGGTVIQGASAGPHGLSYNVGLRLPWNFARNDFTRIDTPMGPVNLRLKKLRSLEA
jgi:hypothetical protein